MKSCGAAARAAIGQLPTALKVTAASAWALFNEWMNNPAHAKWPGGESLADVQLRVWDFMQEVIAENHRHSVVITSHLFSILVLLCKLLGMDLCDFRRLNLSVASMSVAELDREKARLVKFNDTCHLEHADLSIT